MVARDLAEGALKQIHLQDLPKEGEMMAMSATYPADTPPGPAGRWFIEQLRHFGADISE